MRRVRPSCPARHPRSAYPAWPVRRRAPSLVLTLLALTALPAASAAQTVSLRVTDAESSQPIFGALAYLEDGAGTTVESALTDERGRSLFVGLPAGVYRFRVEMIGKGSATTDLFEVAAGSSVVQNVRLESSAIRLEGIEVEAAGGRCSVRPEQGLIVADLWEEARKALTAAAFTDAQQVYRYQTTRYVRDIDRDTKIIRDERRERSAGYQRTPFESRPPEDLLENGFVQTDPDGDLYFAPDANVLLSDPFLDTHCFKLQQGDDQAEGLVGLGFEPVGDRKRVPDIAGTLWLDPETFELEWLEYRYQNLDADLTSPDVGGRVDFQRLPDGTWIVPEWWIRMPTIGYTRDARGQRRPYLESYRVTGGIVTQVQESGGRTIVEAETGTIEGIVLDSLGVEPLRGARVGVRGSNQQVFTNAQGRFSITGLTAGIYEVLVSHARLDAWGYRPDPTVQEVENGQVTATRFVMPSVADVVFEACRGETTAGTAALMGWVRDARTTRPLPLATVQVRWSSFTILAEDTPDARLGPEIVDGLQTTADSEGYYRICAVPENQLLTIVGIHEESESAGDTLRIEEFAGARVHMVDIERGGN